ncbi:hypothetical protein D1872_207570 [compost metagenome]
MKKDIGLLEKGLLCVWPLMFLNILKCIRELRMYVLNQLHMISSPIAQLRHRSTEKRGMYHTGILFFLLNVQNLGIEKIIDERIG